MAESDGAAAAVLDDLGTHLDQALAGLELILGVLSLSRFDEGHDPVHPVLQGNGEPHHGAQAGVRCRIPDPEGLEFGR